MKSIMIVDDSPTMLASIESILSSDNFSVDAADSGDAACKKLNGGAKPDLIISDVNMPNMNGLEFLQEVRKMPRCRFTPVLMLTTESQQELRAKAKALGATGWIVKPVDRQKLLQVVNQVLA